MAPEPDDPGSGGRRVLMHPRDMVYITARMRG